MKETKGKYKPLLVYSSLLKAISSVREYGRNKYGGYETWTTTDPTDHFNAIIRHVRAHMDGENFDKESKLLHLTHAASNLMFEIERAYRVDLPVTEMFENLARKKRNEEGKENPDLIPEIKEEEKNEANECDNIWRRL